MSYTNNKLVAKPRVIRSRAERHLGFFGGWTPFSQKGVQEERGISLLFIVLITSLILSIGLGISALLIQEMRMMGEIGYSVIAFYAADNGIEEAVYDLYQSPSPAPEHSGYLGSAQYHTWAKCCNPELEKCSLETPDDCPLGPEHVGSSNPDDPDYCDALNYCLKSLGSYKTVKRAIEINY